MGEDSLVDSLIEKAERIVPHLAERGIGVKSSYVAFEIDAEQPMLLIATSKDDSKLAVYDAVQTTANELGIELNLGQVVHLRADDPSIHVIESAATSQRHARRYPPVEFGSWAFVNVNRISIMPWRIFELEVLDAIRTIASDDWQVNSSSSHNGRLQEDFDIMIENGNTTVAVELKYYRMRIPTSEVATLLGRQRILELRYPGIKMLLISSSGFSNSALAIAQKFHDIRLLSWKSVQSHGLHELRGAIDELLSIR